MTWSGMKALPREIQARWGKYYFSRTSKVSVGRWDPTKEEALPGQGTQRIESSAELMRLLYDVAPPAGEDGGILLVEPQYLPSDLVGQAGELLRYCSLVGACTVIGEDTGVPGEADRVIGVTGNELMLSLSPRVEARGLIGDANSARTLFLNCTDEQGEPLDSRILSSNLETLLRRLAPM